MKPWHLGLAGLLLACAAIVADLNLVHIPAIRNGWWTLLPLGLGTALAIFAMKTRRSLATIALCFFSGWPGGLYVYYKFQSLPKVEPAIAVGRDFPGVALVDEKGHLVQLENLWKQKPLILVVNRGGWSFIDMGELRGLRNSWEEITQAGATVVSVSVEAPEKRKATADSLAAPFPLLSDADLYLLRRLGLVHEKGGPEGRDVAFPATFVIDKAGKVRWMRRSDYVRERPAPADVIAAVQALK